MDLALTEQKVTTLEASLQAKIHTVAENIKELEQFVHKPPTEEIPGIFLQTCQLCQQITVKLEEIEQTYISNLTAMMTSIEKSVKFVLPKEGIERGSMKYVNEINKSSISSTAKDKLLLLNSLLLTFYDCGYRAKNWDSVLSSPNPDIAVRIFVFQL